jgi:antitoxin YefM
MSRITHNLGGGSRITPINNGASKAGVRLLVIVRAARVYLYGIPVHTLVVAMETVSVNQFRDNLKNLVEQSISRHEPLRVSRRSGQDFVVMSAEDWEREQETLYVLQNSSLMRQLAESVKTHSERKGYTPTKEQMDEITGI